MKFVLLIIGLVFIRGRRRGLEEQVGSLTFYAYLYFIFS